MRNLKIFILKKLFRRELEQIYQYKEEQYLTIWKNKKATKKEKWDAATRELACIRILSILNLY